jgi:hypothetical protein
MSFGAKAEPKSCIEEIEVCCQPISVRKVLLMMFPDIAFANDISCKDQRRHASIIDILQKVMIKLRNYLQTIATPYTDNVFHNFDHANHVVMSVDKLHEQNRVPKN